MPEETVQGTAVTDVQPNDMADDTETVDLRAELERTRKALTDANKEAATRRKKIEAYEAEESKRKQDAMSELEKMQAQLADMQRKAETADKARRDALVRAAVIARASTKQFADTEDALRFIDVTKVTLDDSGAVTGVDEQLDALVKSKPYLLQQQQQAGSVGATNPGRGASTGETAAQRRARLSGMGNSPFGQAGGGGLILPQK